MDTFEDDLQYIIRFIL